MKPLGLYAFVVSLASLAAAVQPADEPAEAHAALAIAGQGLSGPCRSAACMNGWQAAGNQAIHDVADCRQVSDDQGEVEGCKAFVNEALQARLENQW